MHFFAIKSRGAYRNQLKPLTSSLTWIKKEWTVLRIDPEFFESNVSRRKFPKVSTQKFRLETNNPRQNWFWSDPVRSGTIRERLIWKIASDFPKDTSEEIFSEDIFGQFSSQFSRRLSNGLPKIDLRIEKKR
jgi:hypothetical protein